MNKASEGKLAKVHPELASRIRRAAKALASEQTITIEVVQGLRTYTEQNVLYAQGRTKPGKKVTNARGGQSNHNFGLAVDVCPFVSGKPNWDASQSTWEKIGSAGKDEGLEWGGDWVSIVDMPHLQIPGLSIAQCRALYDSGGLSKVWAAVKIDKPILNGEITEPAPEAVPTETTTEKVTTTVVEKPGSTVVEKISSSISTLAGNEQVKVIASEGVGKLATKAVASLSTAGTGAAAGAATSSNPWPWIVLAIVCLVLAAGVVYFWLKHKSSKETQAAEINSNKDKSDVIFAKK